MFIVVLITKSIYDLFDSLFLSHKPRLTMDVFKPKIPYATKAILTPNIYNTSASHKSPSAATDTLPIAIVTFIPIQINLWIL